MLNYSWPGNIRELENVIKRFVILQDEALLLRELQTDPPRVAAAATPAKETAAPRESAEPVEEAAPEALAENGFPEGQVGGNGHHPAGTPAGPQSLAEVARVAMLQAERDLIVPTLRRVRWNRRKAAPLLGVSYKTLLNKIKEHGIVQE
jgi:two-component system response regulator AtoC